MFAFDSQRVQGLVANCFFTVGLLIVNTVHAQEFKVVDVAAGVEDWVMHEPSGRVFASLSESNEVLEFDAQGKETQRIKVGPIPKELIVKRDRLVIGCTKSPELHVVDINSGKTQGTIALNGKGPTALFCSDVDNGLVYCVCNTGDAWWDGEVFHCDIKAMKVLKKTKVQGWGQSHVIHVAMSRDGKWIVPDARGVSSPSGADLMKVNEAEGTFTQVRNYHDSFGPMVADPSNRYWTFGNHLYTLDISKRVRSYGGSTVAIHPSLDMAISKINSGIVIERFSDAAPVATVPLGREAQEPRQGRQATEGQGTDIDPVIQIDTKHQQVFVGTKRKGFWVDLSPFAKQVPELTMLRCPSEVSVLVGSNVQIPVEITGDQKKSELLITSGPKDAKLQNGRLTWQPQAENVGFNTFQLDLKSTEDQRVLDSLEMIIEVTLPRIELGFYGRSMELSPNGRLLMVWGPSPGQEGRHPAHTGSDDVAVVDIRQQKILAKKTLPQGVRCATIDDQYAYVSPNSGNLFHRLSSNLEDSQRMFTRTAPKQLIRMGKDRLIVIGEQVEFFDVTNMKPVPSDESDPNNRPPTIRVLWHGALQIGNRVVDQQTGQTICTIGFANLPFIVNAPPQLNPVSIDPNSPTPLWGRQVSGNSLMTSSGSNIVTWPGQRYAVLSERWPLMISISTASSGTTTNTNLELADLIDGTATHTSTIDVSNPSGGTSISFYGVNNRLIAHNEQVVYLDRQRVFIATIPTKIAEALPVPLHFGPAKILSFDTEKPCKLKPEVFGATKGLTFSLLSEFEGLTIDSKTGELTIDTPKLWEQFISQFGTNSRVDEARRFGGFQESPLDYSQNAKQYKRITGKELPADKVAAQVPVSLSLQSEDGQRDTTRFGVIVLGPRQAVETAKAEKKAEVAKQLAAAQESQRKMLEEQAAQRDAKSSSGTGNERLDQLETRLRRLEAAIDSILKRLDKQ